MPKGMNCFGPRDLAPREVQFPSTAKLCYKGARAWWELPHLFLSLQVDSTPADCMIIHPTSCTICLAKGTPWGGPWELATPKTYRTPRTTTSRAAGTPLPSPPCPPFSMVITITCCTMSPPRGPSRNAVSRAPNNCFRARDPPYPSHGYAGSSAPHDPRFAPCGVHCDLGSGGAFWVFWSVVRSRQIGDGGRQLEGSGSFRTTPLCTPTYVRCPPTRPRPLPTMSQ